MYSRMLESPTMVLDILIHIWMEHPEKGHAATRLAERYEDRLVALNDDSSAGVRGYRGPPVAKEG